MSHEHTESIKLAGTRIEHNHICAFFNSRDEEYDLLLPFIKEGIDRGERAFHVVDPTLEIEHRQRLENVGMNLAALELQKQLEIRVWANAYLRSNGGFD